MPLTRSRYDGHADWYDNWNTPNAERNAADVRDLLGSGDGLCLDLGCGSGLYFDVLAATGRTVVGLDRSADQLRIAHGRSGQIVQGDAAALPFADCTFPTVAAMWISQAGWHQEAPWWGAYIRRRVGMRHHPLADLLNAFISTRLAIEHVAELGDRPVPVILAIRARKPAATGGSEKPRQTVRS